VTDSDQFCELRSGIRLCYRDEGPADAPVMLFIAGLALDLTMWPPIMVSDILDAGFRVIRFDNRDSGRSTHMATKPPAVWRQATGRLRPEDYELDDLAQDTIGLLDALGIDRVDLVGMSMGGMIGQLIAAKHPERVRSFTSIFSTTGARGVGYQSKAMLLSMAAPGSKTAEASARKHLRALVRWGNPAFGFDPEIEEAWALSTWERGGGRAAGAGGARQVAAIQKSKDRTELVRTITAPTLVIHGDYDPMIHPSGGRATADAIPGARLVTIPNLRHNIIASVAPTLTPLIIEHAKAAANVS
jgi:pimeloyl-ACP methyl ester carboxylesterase